METNRMKNKNQHGTYKILKYLALICIVLLLVGSGHQFSQFGKTPRVAIVGAGIGGTAAAYFLNERLNCEIHIFNDHRSTVGGRVSTIDIGGRNYESGGAVIHTSNHYMSSLADKFGYKKLQEEKESTFGVWDGENFRIINSGWKIWSYLKFIYRYGLKPFFLDSYIDSMLDKFTSIYDYQNSGYTFDGIQEMLTSMDPTFVNMSETSGYSYFENLHFSDAFINEIVTGMTRANYGQDSNMQSFVTMVTAAGSQDSSLFAIKGGNKQIAERMLQESHAVLHETLVTKVTQVHDGGEIYYNVDTATSDTSMNNNRFDFVIIAHPLEISSVKFENLLDPLPDMSGRIFHQIIATFVQGKINPRFFGLDYLAEVPSAIVTTKFKNFKVDFNSIGKQLPVDVSGSDETRKLLVHDDNTVWKIFSQKPLTEEDLSQLFLSRNEVKSVSWQAFPHYQLGEKLPTTILSNKLFYINGIEWAASSIEMSLIGAKNSALHVEEVVRGRSRKLRDYLPNVASSRSKERGEL